MKPELIALLRTGGTSSQRTGPGLELAPYNTSAVRVSLAVVSHKATDSGRRCE
jgi:hypothetical protein